MFQTFDATTRPEQGPPRLAALRQEMARDGLAAFLVPRADRHQGEYVAPCDERLAWLTGFTGSAGFCAVLQDVAGVFIDGRYRVQVKDQVAQDFTPVPWPETKLADWLIKNLDGGRVGYDPWLHTQSEIETLHSLLTPAGLTLAAGPNLVDRIWADRPETPDAPAFAHPIELSGEASHDKRRRCAKDLKGPAVLTLPDSICWLINIRGNDIPRIPIVQCFAILHPGGKLDLFIDPSKTAEMPPDPDVNQYPMDAFADRLVQLKGPVQVDKGTAPAAVTDILTEAGTKIIYEQDPCVLPKARKNRVEIDGARSAHQRDAVAMIEFLAWLDLQSPGSFSEIDVVTALEGFRRQTNALQDISFETIAGAGEHGAVVHYRVTTDTNRKVGEGDILLVDSGGQYVDGTTDITRTVAIGAPGQAERQAFTRVLQGMIAVSRIRFPLGVAGRDLDSLARAPLWLAGQDYDHGTGHGVGSYLSVHEGPQRISRASHLALEPGMILSNEPGYYREGAFGIRIENLIVVTQAEKLDGADAREMLCFETLTYVPIDRHLIDVDLLTRAELGWLNAYHTAVADRMEGHLSPAARDWLKLAVAPV